MLSKFVPFLKTTCIIFGASASLYAAPLVDVTSQAPMQLEDFVTRYNKISTIATALPDKTIVEKKALATSTPVPAKPYHAYKLGALLKVEDISVTAMLASFDGRDEPPTTKPSDVVKADRDAEEPLSNLLAAQPLTAPPVAKENDQVQKDEILVKLTENKSAPKVATVTINPSAQVPETDLKITVRGREKVVFEPAKLSFGRGKKEITVAVVDAKGSKIDLGPETSVFVRNEDVLGFDVSTHKLIAKAEGDTEVYFIYQGKVHVLPAVVKRHAGTPDLDVPNELFALADLNFAPHSAKYAKLAAPVALKHPPESVTDKSEPELVDNKVSNDFRLEARGAKYVTAQLKVVDQRSSREASELFPLPRISVAVAGLDYKGLTDRLGSHKIDNIPAHSRVILKFDDPLGRVRATVKEITTGDGEQPLNIDIAMPLNRVISTFEQVAGIVPNMNNGTICGTTITNRSEQLPNAGIEVNLDVRADGPYFFNQFGYLDTAQSVTGNDGRFCFFNVEPGPVAASFFENGRFLSTQIFSAHAGRYQDFEVFLADPIETSAHLAARVTAHEQLGSAQWLAGSLKSIDMIDVVPLGTGQSMTYLDEGYVGVIGGADLQAGRTFALAQAAEFEPVLYTLEGGNANVLPLLPRGFVDDMSIYAQVPYYPDLGVVVAEHGDLSGQGDQPVEMRIETIAGEQVGEGWYYDDKPATKAIFFNLQPGQYVLMVETQDGYWLAADTVHVFNETITYVRTGSQLRRK